MQRTFDSFTQPMNCGLCGRRTRSDAGHGTELCKMCFDLCSEDNHYNDAGTRPTEERRTEFVHMLHRIKDLGGSPKNVILACPHLFTPDTSKPVEADY